MKSEERVTSLQITDISVISRVATTNLLLKNNPPSSSTFYQTIGYDELSDSTGKNSSYNKPSTVWKGVFHLYLKENPAVAMAILLPQLSVTANLSLFATVLAIHTPRI